MTPARDYKAGRSGCQELIRVVQQRLVFAPAVHTVMIAMILEGDTASLIWLSI